MIRSIAPAASLGDNCDDFGEATQDSDLFQGNQTTMFYVAGFPGLAYPDGLIPGTMYYWRIDEVNYTDPNSPWEGPVCQPSFQLQCYNQKFRHDNSE